MVDPMGMRLQDIDTFTVSSIPHSDGFVMRARVNETFTTPLNTTDGGQMTVQSHQHSSGSSVPNLDRTILRSRG
ncbi:hypothetical protein WICPIJ_004270 [Wickerhamomyces pijperi]|uniref:Uncharacterized protein n=1 Tax=Wickerhamomyces pijperi TaxID=599730 RepID=A0A9P8TN20_WICPI|nr:hypothetical protein WICPIJ_004270 [Wickerhamomyces pijperi]